MGFFDQFTVDANAPLSSPGGSTSFNEATGAPTPGMQVSPSTTTQPGGSGAWTPGQGSITPAQVAQQYGADPSVAQYWADKINTGGDPNYYIGRLAQDNAGSGPDAKGGLSGGGASGGSFSSGTTGTMGPMPTFGAVSAGPAAGSSFDTSNIPGFKAPTLADAQTDPGYQFGLDQGNRSLQASAAAKGNLLSGDQLKGLQSFGTDYATTKFNDLFNRDLSGYNAQVQANLGYGNLGNQQAQTANSYTLGAANVALGNKQADQSYALGQANLGLGYYSAGNNFALGQGQLGLGYQNSNYQNAQAQANYGLNANAQQFYQNYAFPIGVGQQATSNTGQYGTSYANQGTNLITGAGNAQAAGVVGGANAYNSAYGTIGNNAMGAYYNSQYGNS